MKLLKIFLLLFISNVISGQECGTELFQSQLDYMDQTRLARDAMDLNTIDNSTKYIPFVAHIIRRSNGTGGLSVTNLNNSMAQLNLAYQQVGFVFELCPIIYIDNDDYFNGIGQGYNSSSEEYQMAIPNRVSDAVNVFFVPNAIDACGWSSFPAYLNSYGKDWTIMDNDCATNGSTLAHEIGHYFNLYHTHQCLSACELVDGSNCGPNVGDELCDTPADPILSSCVSNNCNYFCNYVDANGDSYNPNTNNIMSYSVKACRTFFSPQQIARIQQSYLIDRNNLASSCNGCETSETITGTFAGNEYVEVSDWIESTAIINSGADITYDAGDAVVLKEGFWAKSGSDFHAFIEGCGGISNKIGNERDTAISLEQVTDFSFNAFPNPAKEMVRLEFKEAVNPENIMFTNLLGQTVSVPIVAKNYLDPTFDVSSLKAGIYLVTAINNKWESKSIKLVVE